MSKSEKALEVHLKIKEAANDKERKQLIKKLDELGYEFMEYNQITSIRKKRK